MPAKKTVTRKKAAKKAPAAKVDLADAMKAFAAAMESADPEQRAMVQSELRKTLGVDSVKDKRGTEQVRNVQARVVEGPSLDDVEFPVPEAPDAPVGEVLFSAGSKRGLMVVLEFGEGEMGTKGYKRPRLGQFVNGMFRTSDPDHIKRLREIIASNRRMGLKPDFIECTPEVQAEVNKGEVQVIRGDVDMEVPMHLRDDMVGPAAERAEASQRREENIAAGRNPMAVV